MSALLFHLLSIAVYTVMALAPSALLIEVVPRWAWACLAVAVIAMVAMSLPSLPVTDGGAWWGRLALAGGLTGSMCALPWLMIRLALGSMTRRHQPLAMVIELALLAAFLQAGGLQCLAEVVLEGVRAQTLPLLGEAARWVGLAIGHGLWLGVSLSGVVAVGALVIGSAAPAIEGESVQGIAAVLQLFCLIWLVPSAMGYILRETSEVFGWLLQGSTM